MAYIDDLNAQIATVTKTIATLNAEITSSQNSYDAYWASYKSFADANDWTTAYKRKASADEQLNNINNYKAALIGAQTQLAGLQTQLSAATAAQTAANAVTTANAAVIANQANLTPDQVAAIKLAQITATQQTQAAAAAQATQQAADDKAATTKNYSLIAVVVIIGIIIAVLAMKHKA